MTFVKYLELLSQQKVCSINIRFFDPGQPRLDEQGMFSPSEGLSAHFKVRIERIVPLLKLIWIAKIRNACKIFGFVAFI